MGGTVLEAHTDSESMVPWIRLFLGLGGLLVVGMGFSNWSQPLDFNPFGPRVVLAALAFVAAAAPTIWPSVKPSMRTLAWAWTLCVNTWFVYVAYRHSLGVDDVLGLLPTVVIAAMLCNNRGQAGGQLGLVGVGLVGIALNTTPRFPVPVAALVLVFTPAVISMLTLSRQKLHYQLVVAKQELELRVEQRTAALRESLVRVQEEIVTRQAAEERASAASRAKSSFLMMMSHELRTPLTAILGYTELIEEELVEAQQSGSVEDLRLVQQAATHLLRLIDQMLDLTHVEMGEMPVENVEISVGAAVDEAIELLGDGGATHGFDVRVPEGLSLHADQLKLRQILLNLLANAVAFSPAGEITVEASVREEGVAIAVSDTGEGIPSHALDSVFDRFAQVDGSSTRTHGGVGLGLTICAELAALMHGRIEVQSEVGVGSTFTVWLPIRQVEP